MIYGDIFLLLGTNQGDRAQNLNLCTQHLRKDAGEIIKLSSVYETAPWGKEDQPGFLNQALQLESGLHPEELLSVCLNIEQKMGRLRLEKWGARIIDIDIIYFGTQVVTTSTLVIPHPRLTERKFVLVPLSEIAPDFAHPILQKTNEVLLKECTDKLGVTVFKG
ncbi:2-amino-4-hydroxy-6-hydroxymethyldihydropteridine diphosphokinase [Cytophagales bacterium WSM2-2]|nr:2-amino-4-hydroxy-6-hydroxymethyldihydropteridine diphosphokinase [Cytophagales bacterium WSM2-2]